MQTAEDAARAIIARRLLPADRIKTLWSSLGAERPADALGFVKLLVQRGLLDESQVQQLFLMTSAIRSPPAPVAPPVGVQVTTHRSVAPTTTIQTVTDRAATSGHRTEPAADNSDRALWIGLTAIGLATAAGVWFLLSGSDKPKGALPPVVRNEVPSLQPLVKRPAPQATVITTKPPVDAAVQSAPTPSVSLPVPSSTTARAASVVTAVPLPPSQPQMAPVAQSSVATPPGATPKPATAPTGSTFASRRLPPAAQMKVVALGKSADWSQGHGYGGLLGREIARQAFLVAARERFGLATRDYWLAEPTPEPGSALQLDIVGAGYEESLLELLEGSAPQQELLRTWTTPSTNARRFDLVEFTANCERLARTDFPELIGQRTGRTAATIAQQSPSPLPADIEAALGKMDLVPIFLAVRKLHAADPAKLGATTKWAGLARGYALLGMLTEFHWHPLNKVFKARALVYGQTLAAMMPDDRTALEHRGFAFALAGLHAPALADLKQAREAAATAGAKLSSWAATAEAHCRYDLPALEAVPKGAPQYALANLLRVVTHEYSPSRKKVNDSVKAIVAKRAVAASAEVAELLPECSRVAHGLQAQANDYFEVPEGRPSAYPLRTSLYTTLPKADDLPDGVKKVLSGATKDGPSLGTPAEMKLRGALVDALLDDKVRQDEHARGVELSWSVLARLLLEETLLENMTFAQHTEIRFHVPDPNDKSRADRESIRAALKRHPLCNYVVGGTGNETEDRKTVAGYLGSIEVDAIETKESALIHSIYILGVNASDPFNRARIHHFEHTVADFYLRDMFNWLSKQKMDELLRLSPYSPIARSYLIEFEWDKVSQHAAEWERDSADQPSVLSALGLQYIKAKRLDEAERCLSIAVKLEPDVANRTALAEIYKQRGDLEKWVVEMERLAEDSPEDNGRIRASIAGYFLFKRDLPRARELAEAAGNAGNREGMLVACHVHEVLQDWRNSEFWVEEIAKQHPAYRYEWFLWCKRTGQGNLSAAKAEALKWFEDRRGNEYSQDPYSRWDLTAVLAEMVDDPKTARYWFELLLERSHDTWGGLHAALLAEQQHDPKRRDLLLKQIFATPATAYARRRPKREELRAVAQYMIDDLAAGGKGETSREKLEQTIAAAAPLDRVNCYYFLGEYLSRRGKDKEAIDYWTRCMPVSPLSGLSRTLAGAGLTAKGVKPEAYRELLLRPPKPAPAAQ